MSAFSKVFSALTRQGVDHPIGIAVQIWQFAWIVTAFGAFVLVLGVMLGAAR